MGIDEAAALVAIPLPSTLGEEGFASLEEEDGEDGELAVLVGIEEAFTALLEPIGEVGEEEEEEAEVMERVVASVPPPPLLVIAPFFNEPGNTPR